MVAEEEKDTSKPYKTPDTVTNLKNVRYILGVDRGPASIGKRKRVRETENLRVN